MSGLKRLTLDSAALMGPHGELVETLHARTEADPAAMLATSLAYHGAWLSPDTVLHVGGDVIRPNISVLIVGATSKSRKGTSRSAVRLAWIGSFSRLSPRFLETSGFASGPALVETLAEGGSWVAFEEEFGSFLKVIERPGADLGKKVRPALEGKTVMNRTKTMGIDVAEEGTYALTYIGHITAPEVRNMMSKIDIYGGTSNRLVWIWANDTEEDDLKPAGSGSLIDLAPYRRFRDALQLDDPSTRPVGTVGWDPDAEALWSDMYRDEEARHRGDASPFAAVVGRSSSNILKLAVIYADSMRRRPLVITTEDLVAAAAFWRYAEKSAWQTFGMQTGSAKLDQLVEDLAEAIADPAADGFLTSTEIRTLYGGSTYVAMIRQGEAAGLIRTLRGSRAATSATAGRLPKWHTLTDRTRRNHGLPLLGADDVTAADHLGRR